MHSTAGLWRREPLRPADVAFGAAFDPDDAVPFVVEPDVFEPDVVEPFAFEPFA